MHRFPARIHVLLARDAPVGLVIRRGPSKCVATLSWDRRTDEFLLGQWLKGRIYERRCDLSPDGTHFLYFAMNGKWEGEALGSWTAISRAPYLKALALFAKGDCWNGGGLWTGNESYWLNGRESHTVIRDTALVRLDPAYQPLARDGGECPGVYYPRLIRDGWTLKHPVSLESLGGTFHFEKSCPAGWLLRKVAHAQLGSPPGKGCYWDEHELYHAASGASMLLPQWEWAELDGGRLVWAAEGRLHAGRLTSDGLVEQMLLFDFNDMSFEPIAAPY
jgi:hypothetical protein